MPTDPQPTEERMVYQVPSDTRPGRSYRVDLLANGGAGQCSCTDFGTRRQPAIDNGVEPWSKRTSCKHTRRAAWFFMRDLLKEMAKQEDGE